MRQGDEAAVKLEVLVALYDTVQRYQEGFSSSCGPRCSDCCTQSVTVTELEVDYILDQHRAIDGKEREYSELFHSSKAASPQVLMTTNAYAQHFLDQKDFIEDLPCWNFTKCIFLRKGMCDIYLKRPLGCRIFMSLEPCAESGSAQIPEEMLSVNIAFQQLAEHLDRGRVWGRLQDVFRYKVAGDISVLAFSTARSLPGFLIPPTERTSVERVLSNFYEQRVSRGMRVFDVLFPPAVKTTLRYGK